MLVILGGCSSQGSGGDDAGVADASDDGPSGSVCGAQHEGTTADGDPVTICDAFFAERPFVRPPGDERPATGPVVLYGGFWFGPEHTAATIVTRDGTSLLAVGADGAPIRRDQAATDLPSSMRMPSNRHFYLVYRFTGTLGTVQDARGEQVASIRLGDARPAILLPGEAIDRVLLGPWEGEVSRHVSEGTWSLTDHVPVRITLADTEALSNFPEWAPGTADLPDGTRNRIEGTIENAGAPITSATGACLPALSSYGGEDPMIGATSASLSLYRLTSMHVEGDYQLAIDYPEGTTLGTGMGDVAPVHPITLIGLEPVTEWFAGSHSAYTFGITIHPVTGGGGACTP
jgi:hypothetical protein